MQGNIMVIDDSFVERKIISKAIKRRFDDVNIIEEDNGFDICDKLLENQIHVCVLDIMMPGKDGFTVLREMKQDAKMMDIPVIVCTGISDKTAIERALTMGAYDYFSKPLSEEAMKVSLPMKVKNAIDFMRRKEEAIYLSYHDKLTGLYNRRYSEEELLRIDKEYNFPISIIMGDVNGLKLTNDAFGHTAGDHLLEQISSIMKQSCEDKGVISRIGGDEFLMLLPKTGEAATKELIHLVKEGCEKQKGSPVEPSISFGYSIKQSASMDIMDVYKDAEDKMYACKLEESKTIKSKILVSLVKSLNYQNKYQKMHAVHLKKMCEAMGERLNLSKEQIKSLKMLSFFHNIGMCALTFEEGKEDTIIDELQSGRTHCETGYRIANSLPDITPIARDILSHHERWDGGGYPQGLKGEEIPLNARIIAILDYYDTALHGESQLSKDEAMDYLNKNAGILFDPELVHAFFDIVERIL